MLRSWKLNYLMINGTEHGTVDLTMPVAEEEYMYIPIETDEAEIKRARTIYEKQKKQFNRAKENREFRKRIQEDLEEREW